MRKSLLLTLLMLAGFVSQGQNLLSESFDGTTFPPTGWTRASAATNTWNGNTNWLRTTSGGGSNPTPSTRSGAGMAYLNTYWITTGTADLITPILDFSTTGSKVLSFYVYNVNGGGNDSLLVYLNTSASVTGATQIVGLRVTGAASTGWTQYTYTLPASFTGTTNYIIFRGKSAYGLDIFLDDVDVTNLTPCTGTISGGTATGSTTSPICAGRSLTLTATGYTVGTGMSYQWQSSPSGAGTWSNIAGATGPTYTLASGIATATDFRFVATCNTVTTPGNSNTLTYTINSPLNCYCAPAYSSGCGGGDWFALITLAGFQSTGINQSSPCPTGNVAGHTNYTSLAPVKMLQGGTYSGTLATGFSSEYVAAWIDFNDDGVFSTAGGERVYNSAGTISTSTTSPTNYSVVIPANANIGTHRMRVRLVWGITGGSAAIDPCATYGWGESRDYMAQILSSTPPPPLVTHNAPLCPGGTLTFTATDTAGYPTPMTFTITGPATNGTPTVMPGGTISFTNATTAMNGSYSVTSSYTSGSMTYTSNPTTRPVVIYPAANIAAGTIQPTSTCTASDGSFQLTGLQPGLDYTISYTNPAGTAIGPKNITATSGGTYTEGTPPAGLTAGTYTNIRVQNRGAANPGNCTSNSISITVPPPTAPPTPVVTYQQPLCPGTTLQLSVSNPAAGGTYQWSAPSTSPYTFTSVTSTATRPNMTAAQNGSYCAIVTVNGCVSAPGCVTVTVNNKDPKPVTASLLTYCQWEIALPLQPTGPGLNWYGPAQTIPAGQLYSGPDSMRISRPSIIPRTDIPTGPGQAFVYGVVQNNICPSDTAYTLVIVKPRPAKPGVPLAPVEFCQFSPAAPLSASGSNVRWFSTPTGGVGTATAPTPNTLVPGTYFFYASQTVNGCESERAIITVNVKPKPAPPKVTSPLNLCQNDPVGPLTAIGQNLLWYTSASGGVGVPIAPIPNTGYEDSFMYWVTQTVDGCESDRSLIQAFVNYKPNGVIVGTKQWVCQDDVDTYYYYGNARPDAEFIWSAPNSKTTTVSGQGTPGPFIVRFDSAGTAVVRLQINNKGCISTLIAAPITVRPLPEIDFSLKRDVCRDELVDISLIRTEPGISNYAFDFGSTDTTMVYSAVPGGPFGIRYRTPGEYIVSATATLNTCTSKPLEKRVTVHDLPDATITALNRDLTKEVCSSDTITLSVNRVAEGATYIWTPSAFFQSLEDSLNYIVRAVVSQSAPVKVRVESAYGCVATDSIAVMTKPCCGVFFPTAFAPDGVNKVFRPITIGFHKVNVFRVVNRWGQTVYESKNERAGWNGMYNGQKQDMGVYYYYFSYVCEGKTLEERGEVTLMR